MSGRLFDVAYGMDGGSQTELETGVPVWEARQFAMRVLADEAARIAGRNDGVAETLLQVRERIQHAELGSIIFGHVERYDGTRGQRMFIALLPTGTNYKDAGYKPAGFARATGLPTFTPSTEAS